MAKLILVANWKNHPASQEEALTLIKELNRKKELYKKVNLFIAPPDPYLDFVASKVPYAKLSTQDFSHAKGTNTGEVSAEIYKSLGARLSIIGHSERRALGETDEIVSEKVRAAIKSGLIALLCVGEAERDAEGEHFEFLRRQIKASLSGLSAKAATSVILAYEPVWAIGKSAKDAINPRDLHESIIFIRKVLTEIFGRSVAEKIFVLYGGSVEPTNAGVLAKESSVDGFLVGHASLKPKQFEQIALSMTQK